MKQPTDGLVEKLDEPKEGYACLTVGGQLYGIDIEKSEARMEEMWRKREQERKEGNKKTIEVDKEALTKYIIEHCPHHFRNYMDGDCCERKVTKETCELNAFANELHCPLDCPRINAKEYGCDKGRCSRVKTAIKVLKTPTK